VDLPDSLEQPPVVPEPVALKLAALEGAQIGAAIAKKINPPAPLEPALKRKKAGPTAKSLLPPKAKKVVKC
jgi:hypothetical protein